MKPREASAPASLRVLRVRAGGRSFGIDVARVLEVDRPSRWARLPGAPAYVRGVTEMRGRVVTVVDLALRLGLVPQAEGSAAGVVVVESAEPVGLAVEAIEGVAALPAAALVELGRPGQRFGVLGWAPEEGDPGPVLLVLETEPLVDGRALQPLAELLATIVPERGEP